MAATQGVHAALTTVFTAPSWCADRFAVFIDHGSPLGETSTLVPSSGWVDPSFSSCMPSQYTQNYPTFSPCVWFSQMSMVFSSSDVEGARTKWAGGCCQRLVTLCGSTMNAIADQQQWLLHGGI